MTHDKQCEYMLYPPDANPMHMCHCETRRLREELAAALALLAEAREDTKWRADSGHSQAADRQCRIDRELAKAAP